MNKIATVSHVLASSVMAAFLASSAVQAQTGQIVGKVINQDTKEAVPGATVRIEGTKLGAVATKNGTFDVKRVPAGDATVVVSYVGYKTVSQKVRVTEGQATTIEISIKEDLLQLGEVVAIGYGTTQKRDLTGAYSTVKSEQIVNQPTPSIETTLQGKISGVQITQSNGMAGTATTVRVRGVGSISANTQPLYIVDGVPITTGDFGSSSAATNTNALSFLNPQDIETFDVLKDAAATAIYGSRGANGVIVITTKRGKSGMSQSSAGYYYGMSTPTRILPLLSRDQWIDLYYEAARNDVIAAELAKSANAGVSWNAMKDRVNTDATLRAQWANRTLPQGFTRETAANTDWVDKALRTGTTQEAYFTTSGGNATTQFYFNTTYRKDLGYIVGNDYDRLSGRLALDHKVEDWLTIGTTMNVTREQNNRVNSAWAGGFGTAFSSALPFYPVYDSTGNYWKSQTGLNPVADLENRKFLATTWRTIANGYAQMNLLDNRLTIRGTVGADVMNIREEKYTPKVLTVDPIAEDRRVQVINWTSNLFATYKVLQETNHDLAVTAGMDVNRVDQVDVGTTGQSFPTDYFQTPQSATVRNGYQVNNQYGFLSYFGRANYKLMDRYIFSASLRGDASSRFGDNNRWGYFPAASAAWILSQEDFLKGNDFLTFLKLRTSYGVAGNAEIGNYAWQGTYTSGANYNNVPGTRPFQLANADVTWETSRQIDIGVDFGIWNDRISGSLNYYNRLSTDMLLNERVPASTGFSSILKNVGEMRNQGVEFSLRSFNMNDGDFEWSTDFNITYNTNKIESLGSITNPDAIELGFGETRAIVGYPFASFYLVRYAGADAQTGVPVYYRPVVENGVTYNGLNGNEIRLVEARDSTGKPLPWNASWRVPTGKNYPSFFGGLTNTFRYQGFDLSIMFSYQFGNQIYDDAGKRLVGNMGFNWNQVDETLNRWQQPGDQSQVARLTLKDNRDINTDQHLHDAWFIRLRNITLGYTLPGSTFGQALSRVRVYVTGQNLFVITPFKGWDPEVTRDHSNDQQRNGNQGVTYLTPPQQRSVIFGVNVTF